MIQKKKINFIALRFLIPFLFLSFSGKTQNNRALAIGDTMPADVMKWMLTDQKTGKYMNEAENKLIVLDFWNVGCTACTADFPRLDSIQKENNDRIQIISVTENTPEEIEKMTKSRSVKFPATPKIISDTILNQLFPHMGDPLHVWIDKNGIILYKTNFYNLTTSNVTAVLENKKPYFGERARLKNYAKEKSLLELAGGNLNSEVKYSSILTAGYNDYSNKYPIYSDPGEPVKKTPTISTRYADILTLYKDAFKEELFGDNYQFLWTYPQNWIFAEIKDKSVLKRPADPTQLDQWLKNNIYCYELIVPAEKFSDRFKIMQEDLHRFLGYNAKIITKKTECLSLEKIGALDNIETKDQSHKSEHFYKNRRLFLVNMPLTKALFRILVPLGEKLELPVINNTKFQGNVSLSISADLETLPDLNKELKAFGLIIRKRVSPIKILVITD